ncbi:MAG: DUF4416 family protein [Candidatus Omnitrophota bacterium]
MKKIVLAYAQKLVIGLIFAQDDLVSDVKKDLIAKFGMADFESDDLVFNYTDYYADEFGNNLKRKFISFKNLINPQRLKDIKRWTIKLEQRYSKNKKRRVNIDPGYLTLWNFVLSTTKDYYHRIYLGKGIFGEVTLCFQNQSFREFEWTYPDYKSKAYIEIFNKIRGILSVQLKEK